MSYEPTNWKAGDTVTSAKLNKLEQGISSNEPLVVHITNNYENGVVSSKTMDKTWRQIRNAAPNVYFVEESNSDIYNLKNYQLVEMAGTYGTATHTNDGVIQQFFPPSITLLLLDLKGNNASYRFETSQAYSESENPVWTLDLEPVQQKPIV